MHRRRAHLRIFHEQAQIQLKANQSKTTWSELEVHEMAIEEAKIINDTPANQKKINQILLAKLEGQTLEAIKGKRRNSDYKKLMADILKSLKDCSSPSSMPTLPPLSYGVPQPLLS